MQTRSTVSKRLGLIRTTISKAERTVGGIENLRMLSKFRRFEQETMKRFPLDNSESVSSFDWEKNLTADMVTLNGKYGCE